MFVIINGISLMCSAYMPEVILEYKQVFVRLPVSPFIPFKLVFAEEPFMRIYILEIKELIQSQSFGM